MRALKGEISGAKIKHIGHVNTAIPDWVIYYPNVRLPSGGVPWPPLTDLLKTDILSNIDWFEFEIAITLGIRELLRVKVRDDFSKFSEFSSEQQFILRFGKNEEINIFDSFSWRNIYYNFQAMGEQFLLYLAINRALRRLIPSMLDLPFVLDGGLAVLDDLIGVLAVKFIHNMAGQVILLENCYLNDRFGLTANFELHPEPKPKVGSRIVACQ